MRVLAVADLHWNVAKSRPSAEALVARVNAESFDVLMMIGDAGVADDDSIESCLRAFTFDGPRLFVPGNHELWSHRAGVDLLEDELPRRVEACGWQWLPRGPFRLDGLAIVGSIGWYDYAFAAPALGIDDAFYAAKISPGAVLRLEDPADLVPLARVATARAQQTVARWNDGRLAKVPCADAELVARECARLASHLESVRDAERVIVATHTVPFAELMPPPRGGAGDFAWAYLGSPRLGETIAAFPNVRHVLCGHSHSHADVRIGPIHAINIGAGYPSKRFATIALA